MNVKFLRRIKLVEQPAMSMYESRTYSQILPDGKAYRFYFLQEVKSFITSPSHGMALKGPGLYEISGVAYSGDRADREGDGLGRRRSKLGASRAAGAGAQQGLHPLPHAVALGWRPGNAAKPCMGRSRQRTADPCRIRRACAAN